MNTKNLESKYWLLKHEQEVLEKELKDIKNKLLDKLEINLEQLNKKEYKQMDTISLELSMSKVSVYSKCRDSWNGEMLREMAKDNPEILKCLSTSYWSECRLTKKA